MGLAPYQQEDPWLWTNRVLAQWQDLLPIPRGALKQSSLDTPPFCSEGGAGHCLHSLLVLRAGLRTHTSPPGHSD